MLHQLLSAEARVDGSLSVEEARYIVRYSSGVPFPPGATVDGMLVRLLEERLADRIEDNRIYLRQITP